MNKIVYIVIILMSLKAPAQTVLIRFNNQECATCYNALKHFNAKRSLPVFAVFPEKQQKDTAALEYKYSFIKSGIAAVFSDSMYNRLSGNSKATTVHVFNESGVETHRWNLKNLSPDSLIRIAGLPDFDAGYNPVQYTRDRIYRFNRGLGKLDVYSRQTNELLFSINSASFPFEQLVSRLPNQRRDAFKEVDGIKLNRNSSMNASYTWYEADSSGINLLFHYWNAWLVGDTAARLIDESCMVRFDLDGTHPALYPVVHPDTLYENLMFMFNAAPDSQYVFCLFRRGHSYKSLVKENPAVRILPLANYRIRNGHLSPANTYDFIELPDIQRQKYSENQYGLPITHYPYFVTPVNNVIYHLETRKQLRIIDDKLYKSLMDWDSDELDQDSSRFAIYGTMVSPFDKSITILYRVENQYRLSRYSTALILQKSIVIPPTGLGYLHNLEIDYYGRQIFLKNYEQQRYCALPLELLM
ncbi:MAG: hypothetical protein EOP52_06210 [Sphingobacteriales bacterium]|nr:MAG: hypothetical protein EOP52_06210 [Sphingobacteriales bacterium]